MARKSSIVFLALLLTVAALAGAGCGKKEKPRALKETRQQKKRTTTNPADPGPAKTVTMNGRSVMEGWMKHWGFKWEGPVEKNGYSLDYKELDGDNIATSFANNVSDLAPGSVVFFKFCFVDFDGSNLAQREREIERVLATAKEKGLKLIIGNALPVRKQDGSREILTEDKKFNAFVAAKAAAASDVWVYDFTGVLAGPNGYLKPEYATDDSHPNDMAYSALDRTFFLLLASVG